MSIWSWSAGSGALLGVVIFTLALTPILVWQVRRFGRFSVGRLLGAAAVSVYVAALVTLTMLPLPRHRTLAWCEAYGVGGVQLRPFASFETMYLRATEIGWLPMFTSTLGLQVLLNVVLFIPWGVIARGYFGRSLWAAVVSGAAGSLLIEATQATGVWGWYPCAYRLGDIDDLLTNTLGALLGGIIAPLLLFWMPKHETLMRRKWAARPVTAPRRAFGMLLNLLYVWGFTWITVSLVKLAWLVIHRKIDPTTLTWVEFWVQLLAVCAVLGVPAVLGRGSLGMATVWLRPVWHTRSGKHAPGTLLQRVGRSAVLGAPYALAALPGWEWGKATFTLLVVISAVMVFTTHTHRSLSGVLSRCVVVDSRVGSSR